MPRKQQMLHQQELIAGPRTLLRRFTGKICVTEGHVHNSDEIPAVHIGGWLLQDLKEQSPNSTVLRVYVAGTFDKYPAQLKNALCTHPRVQLLYSIGKVSLAYSFFPDRWSCLV